MKRNIMTMALLLMFAPACDSEKAEEKKDDTKEAKAEEKEEAPKADAKEEPKAEEKKEAPKADKKAPADPK